MKKLILLLILTTCTCAFAQDASTPLDLKLELARAKVQIATLTAQLHEAQFQIQMYDAAMGVLKRRTDDQAAVDAAKKTEQDAELKAEKK
jgi:hypothetical protein